MIHTVRRCGAGSYLWEKHHVIRFCILWGLNSKYRGRNNLSSLEIGGLGDLGEISAQHVALTSVSHYLLAQ
jgi:hypothetical protein